MVKHETAAVAKEITGLEIARVNPAYCELHAGARFIIEREREQIKQLMRSGLIQWIVTQA
jgi:hypothetical protein